MKLVDNQQGVTKLLPISVAVSVIGLIFFLLLSSSAPFNNNLLNNLYPKSSTKAAMNDFPVPYDDDYSPTSTLPDKSTYQYNPLSLQEQLQKLTTKTAATGKPNIIVIISDDQPYSALSIAGNPILKTPNIDNLAKPGLYFKNAYVPEGICSPSRASIWTGKLPHVHGVTTLGVILPPDQLTFPEILQANGYNTAMIGKCHLGDPSDPQVYTRGFDTRLIAMPDNGTIPDWYNYQLIRNGVPEQHTEYITDYLTDQSISYINSKADDFKKNGKPFFLWLAQPAPHPPTIPPRGSNRYSIDQIHLPPSSSDDLSTKPPVQGATKMHLGFYLGNGPDYTRGKLKDAYEVMSNFDDNVGRLTKTLDDLALRDNTVIVFLTDNGVFFGEHQLFQKGPFFYEEQVKVPLIISYPKLISNSRTTDALTSSMDIMPTLLDLAEISSPGDIQGKSFLNVLQGQTNIFRRSLYFEYPTNSPCLAYPMRGVVMDNFKWVHYLPGTYAGFDCPENLGKNVTVDGFDFELYDLKNDPFEMNNLMKRLGPSDNPLDRMLKDPALGKIVQKLRKERAIWATDTNDPSRFQTTSAGIVQLSTTKLEVNWTNPQGTLTSSEVEYQEKNCSACQVLENNDFNYASNIHKVVLTNLKPDTTYKIRAFSIGPRGVGGYVDLEGTTPSTIPGDTDGDGDVDIFDYNQVITDFGKTVCSLSGDVDQDCDVDIFDYNIVVTNFGRTLKYLKYSLADLAFCCRKM